VTVALRAQHWGDRQAVAAARPPLVLLHGLFGSAANFGVAARRLACDRPVVGLDLRNHGASPHADGMAYGAQAADVAAALQGLGLPPAVVVGHSMGGKVAMRLALDRPDLVRALVVADIAPVAYEPAFRGYAAAMLGLRLRPGLTRAEADAALAAAVPEAGVRAFLLQNLRLDAAPRWRIGLRQIAEGLPQIEGWSGGGQYAGPVLSLAGGRSDYVRAEHRALFRAMFPACRFATLRDAGHWLHADRPEEFAATLGAFAAAV
jgi:pimeloyl-ACP methyl ester carboxylesterase